MNNLKWADVAHMYTKNEPCIVLEIEGVGKRELLWQQGSRGVMYATSAQAKLSRWSQHKPILRHLEDMTEEEDAECAKVHCYFVDKEIAGLPSVIWALAKRHASFNQYSAYWLYKRGFDIHGLIDSGEAIRKPTT